MANKPKILVKNCSGGSNSADGADQPSNIYVVDPNKILDNGVESDRYVAQDELVMYVEVSAHINTKIGIERNDQEMPEVYIISKNKWYSSTKSPVTQDFLTDSSQYFTTDWTKMFDKQKPQNTEGFGIQNIDIDFNASLVPKVHIEFIDVRGKNLLENVDNSPYNVFYIFPYPLFQLTVKGYYGKAVSMPLVMEKVITKFDSSTGSYIISADFKSWTFAMLNDFTLLYALITPYMFKLSNNSGNEELTDQYLGQQKVDEIYDAYHRRLKEELVSSGKMKSDQDLSQEYMLDKLSALELFNLSTLLSKGIDNDDKLKSDREIYTAMANILKLLVAFEEGVQIQKDSINYSSSILIEWLATETERMRNQIAEQFNIIIKNGGISDYDTVYLPKLVVSNFTGDTATTSDVISSITIPLNKRIIDFHASLGTALESIFVNGLHFIPNIENVVKVLMFHIEAFIELLLVKTEDIFNSVLNAKSLPEVKQNNYEIYQMPNKTFRRLPWPEYYAAPSDTTLKDRFDTIKTFPGCDYLGNPEVLSWGEVSFINEMYEARKKFKEALSRINTVAEAKIDVYVATPLSTPIPATFSRASNEIPVMVREIMERMLCVIVHNGLMYKNFINGDNNQSYIKIINEISENDLSNLVSKLDFNTLNSLYNEFLSYVSKGGNSTSSFNTFVNRFKESFPNEYNRLLNIGSDNSSIFFSHHLQKITRPHGYAIPADKLPTDGFKKCYTNIASVRVINKLPLDMKLYTIMNAGESDKNDPTITNNLNIFNFNTATNSIEALTYTNDFTINDLFLCRKSYDN